MLVRAPLFRGSGATTPVPHLSDDDVENLGITPSEVADAIEAALIAKAEGRLHAPPKTAILPGDGRYAMSTLAMGDDGFIVVKQVTICSENPTRGLPPSTATSWFWTSGPGFCAPFWGPTGSPR